MPVKRPNKETQGCVCNRVVASQRVFANPIEEVNLVLTLLGRAGAFVVAKFCPAGHQALHVGPGVAAVVELPQIREQVFGAVAQDMLADLNDSERQQVEQAGGGKNAGDNLAGSRPWAHMGL
jgi:hypothetical protein